MARKVWEFYGVSTMAPVGPPGLQLKQQASQMFLNSHPYHPFPGLQQPFPV